MRKNYYLILRLAPEATMEQIRSAFRRRAIELHPDLSGVESDQFIELQEAYDVLSDPTRRAIYDREAEEIPIRRMSGTARRNLDLRKASSRTARHRPTGARFRREVAVPVVRDVFSVP